ncbi:MAG: anti-sigma factor [Pseudolysinimonas sp.]
MNQRSEDVGPDSGAYVLHALSDAENARFESVLAGSEEARAEVTELADTAVELGLSVAPVDPPAALRGRIMDQLATTPQLAPLAGLPASDAAPSGSAQERARRRWTVRPASTLLAAAAAVALIFGGGVAVNAVIQGQQASATASQISRIQAAADYQRSTVHVSTGGTATLIWSAALKRSAVMVLGIDKLPGGKTYELWYLDKSGATPAGTFDASGSSQSVVLTGDMKAGDTVGVTIEPSGGSRSPTTAPIAIIATA